MTEPVEDAYNPPTTASKPPPTDVLKTADGWVLVLAGVVSTKTYRTKAEAKQALGELYPKEK